jgi:hypothetical protein
VILHLLFMLDQAIKGAERSAVQWIPFCIL